MTLGERIRNRRKELHMSADELARKLGKNRATIYRYENGEIENMPIDILEPVAEALLTTPDALFGWGSNKSKDVSEEDQEAITLATDLLVRMMAEKDFYDVAKALYELDAQKIAGFKALLDSFSK